MEGSIWYNGHMVAWEQAQAHVLTHGLHYASSVFEGERVYDGKIFKLQEHTERLINSAETLDFTIPYSAEEINAEFWVCLEEGRALRGARGRG